MTNLLETAMAKVAALPPAAQEKIGEERLRAGLHKGVRSLQRGEGKELDMSNVIKRARAEHGKR
jgi:hypothetical protein